MSAELHNVDGWEFMDTLQRDGVDHIISDIEYGVKVPFDKLLNVCSGNIILFEKPNRDWPIKPDKIYYWIKPSLPKNTVNQLADPVEWINVWQRGCYNGPQKSHMQNGNYCTVRYDLVEGVQMIPEQKPLSLMEWLVRLHTEPGSTVLDFQMGSGTTGEACQKTRRNFIGCEIDPQRYGMAQGRLGL